MRFVRLVSSLYAMLTFSNKQTNSEKETNKNDRINKERCECSQIIYDVNHCKSKAIISLARIRC